jgi:hypothetical protein
MLEILYDILYTYLLAMRTITSLLSPETPTINSIICLPDNKMASADAGMNSDFN